MPAPHHSPKCRPGPSFKSSSRFFSTHAAKPKLSSFGVMKRERDPGVFGRRSNREFERPHSLGDELHWLDAEGPTSPSLIDHLATHGDRYDYCLFFSYRYYHAYHGVRATAARAILVPTAERDAAIGLTMFQSIFGGVRALLYNSHEERTMISVSGNVSSNVVANRIDVPQNPCPSPILIPRSRSTWAVVRTKGFGRSVL
jgi:hypothetical protein